jgi:signal transduction histidine kinase/CheY-like chemotaxis protein
VKATDSSLPTLRRVLSWRLVPYGLFILSYALSVAASWYLSSTASAAAFARANAEFEGDSLQTRRQIQAGLNSYFEVVRAGSVLLSADNEINGAEFRRFVAGLQLRERYPGLEGIGFAQCVSRRGLRRLLRAIDLDGNRVSVWPDAPRPEHCPTLFLEPVDARNTAALGFDLASEPDLAAAMARARDSGEPEASSKLQAIGVRDTGWRGDFVLFIPVYRAGPRDTVAARRRAFMGFVFSPFDSRQLLQDMVASAPPSIALGVYDGPVPAPERLLSTSEVPYPGGLYSSSDSVQIGGRRWLVSITSVEEPAAVFPLAARQTLFGGVLLSFLLFLITAAQVRAWEKAARHERELRAAAEALHESEAQAHAANRAKDEFLATLSHELRTPLNVVLGWVSMLRHGSVREDRRAEALAIIERNARQQVELIEDLLDVSRIVTGKMRVQLRALAVQPVIAGVVDSLRPTADSRGISMTLTAASDLPSIHGDADRLHQIAWNLVSNAIKFTPSGGRASVDLARETSRIVLTVRDTGVGIAPEFIAHVFERFRQADSSTTRAHGGVGLGLSIVQHLVELHNGTIAVTSEGRDRGTSVVVTFPIAQTGPLVIPATADGTTVSAVRLDGKKVLVVDDDPGALDLLVEALAAAGARVSSANSARRALEQFDASGADAIVSDIAMPDEDGFWLMNRIRALPDQRGRTPAIALTALARSEDRARVMQAGYQLYFTKPVRLGELQAGLAMLIAESAERRSTEAKV